MTLKNKIELLHKSSERLKEALALDRTPNWWTFIRREAWLHLRRTLELLWLAHRRSK